MKVNYISFCEFMQWVKEQYPNMPTTDTRPYKTVWRYLTAAGFFMRGQGEDMLLVKRHLRNNPSTGTRHALIGLLDTAQRYAVSASHKTKGNYKLMCIDEDLEEIEMLKDAWRVYKDCRREPLRSNLLFLRPAGEKVISATSERSAPSEAEAFADKMTKQWEEDQDGFFSDIAAAF